MSSVRVATSELADFLTEIDPYEAAKILAAVCQSENGHRQVISLTNYFFNQKEFYEKIHLCAALSRIIDVFEQAYPKAFKRMEKDEERLKFPVPKFIYFRPRLKFLVRLDQDVRAKFETKVLHRPLDGSKPEKVR